MTQDPGWRPPRGLLLRAVVWPRWSLTGKAMPLLVAWRTAVLASLAQWIIFLGLLWALEITPSPARWWGIALIVLGVLDVGLVRFVGAKPLPGETPADVAGSYDTTFTVGYAAANSVVLLGFVFYFLTGRIWIYLLGLPFGITMLVMSAPTLHALERRQREINSSGRHVAIAEAVMLTRADLAGRPR